MPDIQRFAEAQNFINAAAKICKRKFNTVADAELRLNRLGYQTEVVKSWQGKQRLVADRPIGPNAKPDDDDTIARYSKVYVIHPKSE